MGYTWQLQEAKNKFSELVDKAQNEGPQIVTRHGKEAVVIISVRDYQKIIRPKSNLFQFMQSSPLHGMSIDTERDKSASREIEL
jgi:prevent-host-death family protein